ncbi:GtrA family protein, partial [Patescibacteria group bacterium]|nr:GtrA family protein [Patescibacteria group bacterium]
LKVAKPELYDSLAFFIIPFFLIATPLGALIAYKIGTRLAIVWQLAKYIVVGGMNTLVDIGILTLTILFFKNFGVQAEDLIYSGILAITFYSIYKGFSFIIANINSFYWNKYWTFSAKDGQQKSSAQFVQFFVVSLIGLLINVVIASLVFRSVPPFAGLSSDQWGLIGAAAGSLTSMVWNFLGYKFIVFEKRS